MFSGRSGAAIARAASRAAACSSGRSTTGDAETSELADTRTPASPRPQADSTHDTPTTTSTPPRRSQNDAVTITHHYQHRQHREDGLQPAPGTGHHRPAPQQQLYRQPCETRHPQQPTNSPPDRLRLPGGSVHRGASPDRPAIGMPGVDRMLSSPDAPASGRRA